MPKYRALTDDGHVPLSSDYLTNDSSVPGTNVTEALDNLSGGSGGSGGPIVPAAPQSFPLLATVNGINAVSNHIALSNGVSPGASPGDAASFNPVNGFGVLASSITDPNTLEVVVRTPFPLSAQATIEVSLDSVTPSPNDPDTLFVALNLAGTYGQIGSLDTVFVYLRDPDTGAEAFAGYVSVVLTVAV